MLLHRFQRKKDEKPLGTQSSSSQITGAAVANTVAFPELSGDILKVQEDTLELTYTIKKTIEIRLSLCCSEMSTQEPNFFSAPEVSSSMQDHKFTSASGDSSSLHEKTFPDLLPTPTEAHSGDGQCRLLSRRNKRLACFTMYYAEEETTVADSSSGKGTLMSDTKAEQESQKSCKFPPPNITTFLYDMI